MTSRYINENNTIDNVKVPFYVYIDTRLRTSGTRSNFTYRIRNLERFSKVFCCLINYEFSNVYQVDSSNNKFVIEQNNVRIVVNIDHGSYSTTQFCAELKAKLESATTATTWTVSFDEESDRISIKEAGAQTIELMFSDSEFTSKSFLRESSNIDFTLINDTFYTFTERYTSLPQSYLLLQCSNLAINPSTFSDNVGGAQILSRIIIPPRQTINFFSESHISYNMKEIDISGGILNFRLLRPDGSEYTETTSLKDYSFVIAFYPVA